MEQIKRCSVCKEIKSLSGFHKHKNKKYGVDSWCKKCIKKYRQEPKSKICHNKHNKKYYAKPENKIHQTKCAKKYRDSLEGRIYKITYNYKTTRKQAIDLIRKQDQDVCECCGGNSLNGKRLSIDHNHQTGKIRGVLCDYCNLKVFAYEEKEFAIKAKLYLEKYQ